MMKLSQKEISHLAGLLPDISRMSIFHNIRVETDGTEEKTLTEKGILKNGTIAEDYADLLLAAASAKKCGRLVLRDSEFFVEKYTYKGKDRSGKERMVLVENDHGDMVFRALDNFRELILSLSQFTGMSYLKTADVEIRLQKDELMVFLASVDARRRNALHFHLGLADTSGFELKDLTDLMLGTRKNSLMHMLVNNYNYTVPAEKELGEILKRLRDKSVIEESTDKEFRLALQYENFASNFLIPQTLIMLEAFHERPDDGETVMAEMLFVTAGVKEICSFLFTDEEVEFAAVSGGHMLKTIENFMACPDLIQ
jgi:hypothetical protein